MPRVGTMSTRGWRDTGPVASYPSKMGKQIPWWAFDLGLAVLVYAADVIELLTVRPEAWRWGLVIDGVACALLSQRRRAPLVIGTLVPLILLSTVLLGSQLEDTAAPLLPMGVAIYTLGRWIADLRGLFGLGLIGLSFFVEYLTIDVREHDVGDVFFVTALIVPPYIFGRVVQRMAVQKALIEDREELVKREAVRGERDRIARELHDVVAHSVSAMVVQTAAAQDLVRADPDKAEQVLRDVADTGRRALVETGRLLHVIRDEADELGLAPTPGMADLDDLVGQFREGGLHVELRLDEQLPALPAGIDVSAYRIAEEALTNALRYGDGTASLEVTAMGSGVAIRASNPSANGLELRGSGLGLRGIAERVSLLGGTMTHGVSDGRFELAAILPGDSA
jgi:signal transduction histidine kinase